MKEGAPAGRGRRAHPRWPAPWTDACRPGSSTRSSPPPVDRCTSSWIDPLLGQTHAILEPRHVPRRLLSRRAVDCTTVSMWRVPANRSSPPAYTPCRLLSSCTLACATVSARRAIHLSVHIYAQITLILHTFLAAAGSPDVICMGTHTYIHTHNPRHNPRVRLLLVDFLIQEVVVK